MRYVELESARLVEEMRMIRDVYLDHLIGRGCKPSIQLEWSVFRYGVRRWSASVLSYVLGDYIEASQVDRDSWRKLFGIAGAVPVRADIPSLTTSEIHKTTRSLLTEGIFALRAQGGPFGRHYQAELARERPWNPTQINNDLTGAMLRKRTELWDECCPWTDGIGRLFDAVQAELDYQDDLYIDRSSHGSEPKIRLELPLIEQICHRHLVQLKSGEVGTRNLGDDRWLGLLRELDSVGILPEHGLSPLGLEVLATARKKKLACKTWVQCFQSKALIRLDERVTTLRITVNRSLHTVAKRAKYEIDKIEGKYKSKLIVPSTPD